MRLVFLYGPPGVGKLTVARELADLTGFRVFHNHLSRDLVEAVFPRGSRPHGPLIRAFRRQMLDEAARERIDLIFTYVYAHPDDEDDVRSMIEPIRSHGGAVLFAQLACDHGVLLERVADPSRRAHGKLTDPEGLRALLARYDLSSPVALGESLRIDCTVIDAATAAGRIAAHYELVPRRET